MGGMPLMPDYGGGMGGGGNPLNMQQLL
jgi:hypothetical protein